MRWKLTYRLVIFLILSIGHISADAQILDNPGSMALIRKGIAEIYNLEFSDAENILDSLNLMYPGHPATYMYKGLLLYYENYPLTPANPACRNFENQLRTAIRVCESKEGWTDDPEKLMIDLCARGLLLLYYTENDMSREVIPMVAPTYMGVRKAFDYRSVYPDFSYFTGLYNYYREAYPEHHPVYKAVAFLFPHGDKKEGLKELEYSAENAIVLKAESYSILSWISIYYENDYAGALNYSRTLSEKYPANLMFRSEYIKNLILLKKYDEAEKLLALQGGEDNLYYRGQVAIYHGLLEEKKYHNYASAAKYYREGINVVKKFGPRGKDYVTYGNDGLRRIKDLQSGRPSGKKHNEGNPDGSSANTLNF